MATLTVAAPNVGLVRLGILLCRLPSCQGHFSPRQTSGPRISSKSRLIPLPAGRALETCGWPPGILPGDQCSGPNDLIYRDHDPERLRELAPTIPFELVEEFIIVGNAS